MNHEVLIQMSREWRDREGYVGAGGVVVIFDGKIQGWVNELRDPQSWVPGCIAIAEDGSQWITVGGNEYDGSISWIPFENQSS